MNVDDREICSVGVLGAGTWGMALARMLAHTGKRVTVWSALKGEVETLSKTNRHPKLPGVVLPEEIQYTLSMEEVCKEKDVLLFAVPSIYVRHTARQAKPFISKGQWIVDVAKGMEADTLMTLSQVIRDELQIPVHLAVLSGPTHAEEVARDLPTTIVAACEDLDVAQRVQRCFSAPFMRVYTNQDVLGIEICGAIKNIIALAAGISDGLGYGDNSKAALITRGLAEMARLGTKMGFSPYTFTGLAGMGDLIVTCTSPHSRNNRAGYLLGKGFSSEEAVREVGMVVEGMNALPGAVYLAKKYNVQMPIVFAVNDVVNHGMKPSEAVNALLRRDLKSEVPKFSF